MAKMTVEEMVAAVKEMTVLELSDLVKALEKEFGVRAAAQVVAAAPAAGGAALLALPPLKRRPSSMSFSPRPAPTRLTSSAWCAS